ncbi:hypothetical protein L7F22_023775 [Adiantum nelumboides]|nr:hypothetical protein [Adiantum nelumboides]
MWRSRGFLLLFVSWLLLCISFCALSEQGDPDAQEVDDDSASDPGDALIANSAQEYSDVELVPARGVHTVYFFPKDADKSIPAGEEAEVIVGISNHGDLPLNVHSIWASLHLAYDQRYQIQNFTASEFGKSIVPPSVQASFPYTFTVSKFLQPGRFALVASIFYEVDGTPHRSVFYNGTIEVIEPSGFLSGETLFLVTLGSGMLGLLGMWLYGQFQKLSKKTRRTKKVETGTRSMDAVNNEWLQGAAAQPIPILPPPSLPDPPASPVITPSTSHPVPPIQPPDVSPDHALSDSDSDLDVADATPEVDLAPPRREKRIPGWLYSTVASSGVTELPVPPPAGLSRRQQKAKALSMPSKAKLQEQNPPDSPQFSFMRDLDDIVPPEDMFLEEPLQQEVQSKLRLAVNKESRGIKKKHHKKNSHKHKTFKLGDKDVKFDSFNGRCNNNKALAFICQFEVAFAEGNFKEKSKLRHVEIEEEDHKHLATIFQELRNHKLLVNAKKSEFFLKEIHYLGHIVSHNQVRMDPEKIKAIVEWPTPITVYDVRSFLGLCSYYRRFMRSFAAIAGPLHDLTKKRIKFHWGPTQKEAFEKLKYLLSHGPILIVPDLRKCFEVYCDASGDCVGAVLNQEGHAVAYESRRLRDAELHASIYEKELMAVIHALSI